MERIEGAAQGELDLLVDLAGQAPGLILGPDVVRLCLEALRRAVPDERWRVSELVDAAGEEEHLWRNLRRTGAHSPFALALALALASRAKTLPCAQR